MACSAQHVANKVLSSYQWRLATKKFDPTKNVSNEDLEVILRLVVWHQVPTVWSLGASWLLIYERIKLLSSHFALKRNFTSHAMVLVHHSMALITWLFFLLARTSTQSLLTLNT